MRSLFFPIEMPALAAERRWDILSRRLSQFQTAHTGWVGPVRSNGDSLISMIVI
jgi:hypothetical protein